MTGERYAASTLTTFAESMVSRALDAWMPELVPYLSPGMRVLDVGCGPGSITVELAERVMPGEVVGIDALERSVDMARQVAADRGVRNVSFQVADALELPFGDGVFDLVYSNTVLHFFNDPGRAVREQRRVARPGGWVVAAGVRDFGLVRRYPPCPAWERVEDARAVYFDRHRDMPKPDTISLGQSQVGRRCVGYFADAGLGDLTASVGPTRVLYPGADLMGPSIIDGLPWSLEDETSKHDLDRREQNAYHDDFYRSYRRDCDAMIGEGLIEEETVRQAMEEAKAWYANPHAFHFYALVFVAGRVPPTPGKVTAS